LWGIVERKMIPPPKPIDPLAGGGADLPATKPRQSGGTLPEKRAGKNGAPGGKPGAKPKRRK
jgi:hypothetical protein